MALCWPFYVLWFMEDHAFCTDKSSARCSDVFLTDARRMTDARRAEAVATTFVSNSVEKSTLGEEAINATLPFKKASSPGRFDRDATPCWRVEGDRGAVDPDTAAPMYTRAWCASIAAAAASRSALSAATMSRCNWRRRPTPTQLLQCIPERGAPP